MVKLDNSTRGMKFNVHTKPSRPSNLTQVIKCWDRLSKGLSFVNLCPGSIRQIEITES